LQRGKGGGGFILGSSFIEGEMERVGIASDYGVFIFSSSWGDVGDFVLYNTASKSPAQGLVNKNKNNWLR